MAIVPIGWVPMHDGHRGSTLVAIYAIGTRPASTRSNVAHCAVCDAIDIAKHTGCVLVHQCHGRRLRRCSFQQAA